MKSQPSVGIEDLVSFKEYELWLNRNYRPFTVRPVLNYSKKYGDCLLKRDFSKIGTFTDGKRASVIKALSAFSKYLGMHEEFKLLLKNYGLKWRGRKTDDLIIARLLKNPDDRELIQWIKNARKIGELKNLVDLMLVAGLRLVEGIECHNLIIKLEKTGRLHEYYDGERHVLEHFRFKDIFIRHNKKVFISFAPAGLINCIAKSEPINYDRSQKLAEYYLKTLRFADIRELFASQATKHLREPEIDFLQGRISASVFMRNYFNPIFIADLQKRALTNANEFLKKLGGEVNE